MSMSMSMSMSPVCVYAHAYARVHVYAYRGVGFRPTKTEYTVEQHGLRSYFDTTTASGANLVENAIA